MNDSGLLYILSAPSGTGKTTLIKALIKCDCFLYNIQSSISYTTRTKRIEETHGKDYYFISSKKFKYMISKNMFLEYAKVFNNYYGTRNNIKNMLKSGAHIILDIDWNGTKQIKCKLPKTCTIFILPPSKKELERRLLNRGQDTKKTIHIRMQKAIKEISHFKEYDYVIINKDFNIALLHLQSIILSKQLLLKYQKKKYNKLINHLT